MASASPRGNREKWVAVAVVILLYSLAGLAVLGGWATDWLACHNEGTETCELQGTARAQFYVALAGLIPLTLFVRALRHDQGRQALVWLAVAILTYLTWGVLNDAAVHGWDDLKYFPKPPGAPD
jgi:hypothetical protein